LEGRSVNVICIERHVELGAYLCARSFGHKEEAMEFSCAAPLEPFRDIRHYRHRRPSNLVDEPEVASKLSVTGRCVNRPGQRPRLLPGNQVFEAVDRRSHLRRCLTHCSLLIAHCSLLIAHCSLLIAHCSLLIAHCSLLIAPRSF